MALASATALLAELHGRCTRAIEDRVGVHDGLTTASRSARRRGLVSPATARRMERLDVAMHVVRHISTARVQLVADDLLAELAKTLPARGPDPWEGGLDPWAPLDHATVLLAALGAAHGVPPRRAPDAETREAAAQTIICTSDSTAQTTVVATAAIGVVTSRPRRRAQGAQASAQGQDAGCQPELGHDAESQSVPAPSAPDPGLVADAEYDDGLGYDPCHDVPALKWERKRALVEVSVSIARGGQAILQREQVVAQAQHDLVQLRLDAAAVEAEASRVWASHEWSSWSRQHWSW
jgi:hypothetical protein